LVTTVVVVVLRILVGDKVHLLISRNKFCFIKYAHKMNILKKFNFMGFIHPMQCKYNEKCNKDICTPISNEINCGIYMDRWKWRVSKQNKGGRKHKMD
jgi:hypothetical protein